MQSWVGPLEGMLRRGRFHPARVQRTYQWRRDQVDALLTDFEISWRQGLASSFAEAVPEKPEIDYFLGSFVLRTADAGSAEVFDGLQRFITLTILLAVLRDLLTETHPAIADALDTVIHADEATPRVALGGSDPTLASLIQKRSEAVKVRRGLSDDTLRGRLLIATSTVRNRLSQWSTDDLAGFSDYVLRHVHCNVIVVGDERIARQIFITTNNRGLPLSEPDILRSQINSIPFRSDVAEKVLHKWKSIEDRFDEAEDYAGFLRSLDFLTRKRSRGPRGLTDLGEYLGETLRDDLILDWLVDAETFAEAWNWLQAVRAHPASHDPFSGAVFRCFLFDQIDWQPLGLVYARHLQDALGGRDRKKGRHLGDRFASLGRYCLLHLVLETDPSEVAARFGRALSDERAGRNAFTHSLGVSDEEKTRVSHRLREPFFDRGTIKTILLWMELQNRRAQPVTALSFGTTAVLPARSEDGDHWSAAFPDRGQRQACAHMLGNYVLSDEGATEHDSAGSFRAFRKTVLDAKVNSAVRKSSDWTPEQIERRTARLADEVMRDFG